jgi:hypothetical protein
MTVHEETADKLSDYLDDELTADERQVVERHVAECAECASTLDDLRRVVSMAGSLRDHGPTSDLWEQIAQHISSGPRAVAPLRRRFAFTLPQFAAASVLLAILSGSLAVYVMRNGGPEGLHSGNGSSSADPQVRQTVNFDDEQYDAAVHDLQQALASGRDRLDAATINTVEQDLRVIDEAVDDARRALAADPANGYLSGYLVQTRQRKLELLRRAAALTQVDTL